MSLIYSALNSLDKKHASEGMSTEPSTPARASSSSHAFSARWFYVAVVGGVVAVAIAGAIFLQRQSAVPHSVALAPVAVPVEVPQPSVRQASVPAQQPSVPELASVPAQQIAVLTTVPVNQSVKTPADSEAAEQQHKPAAAPRITVETRPVYHVHVVHHVSRKVIKSVDETSSSADAGQLAMTAQQAIDAGNNALATSTLAQLASILPPESLTLLRLRAWQALHNNEQSRAIMLYGQIVDRLPDDESSSINLAVLNWKAGNHDEARRIMGRLAERHPDSDTAQSYVAKFGEPH